MSSTVYGQQICPFKDKLMEIEEPWRGIFKDAEAIETQRLIKIINSATEEILLLFSTTNSFMRAEHDGLLGLLREACNRGVRKLGYWCILKTII